jgi:hypothetical protein
MKQGSSKNWWQTAAGVMTGVAALLTAIAGLIVALAQVGSFGRDESEGSASVSEPARPASSTAPRAPTPPQQGSGDTTQLSGANVISPPNLDAVRAPIELPARREYVLGPTSFKARYVLVDGRLARHSSETSTLAIKVRLLAEGEPNHNSRFSSLQFTLAIEEVVSKAQPSFTEYVRSGDSIERYVTFTIPPGVTEAVLRIKVGADSHAEIPLKLPLLERG